jgi:hypothetical protein
MGSLLQFDQSIAWFTDYATLFIHSFIYSLLFVQWSMQDGAIALASGLSSNEVLETVDLMGMPLLGKNEKVRDSDSSKESALCLSMSLHSYKSLCACVFFFIFSLLHL